VLVLLALLVAADRVGAAVAERVLADELQRNGALPSRPEVDVRGVPFLTQALQGRYDRIDVVARDVPAGELAGTPVTLPRLSATLRGVRVPLEQALSGAVTSVPVERVDARARLPFDVVRRGSDVADLDAAAEGDRLRLRGTVRVLGQQVTGSVLSALTVEDGQLVVTAEEFDVPGGVAGRLLDRALAGRFDARIPLTGLPYGLQVDDVRVRPDGLDVAARADDTELSAPAP
jgi:hypothetical protein